MTRPRRLFLYAPFALAAVALAAWYGLWRQGERIIRVEIERFAADQRASGGAASYGAVTTRGFPFYLRAAVDDVSIARDGMRYEAERLYIDALPYRLDRLVVSTRDEQRLVLRDGQSAGAGETTVRILAEGARASVEAHGERGWVLKVQSGPARLESDGAQLALDAFLLNVLPGANDAPDRFDASLVASGVRYSDAPRDGAFDRIAASIALERADRIDDPALWRAAGGALVLHGLEAVAGEVRLAAQGRIALDEDLRPEGRIDIAIVDAVGAARLAASLAALGEDDAAALEGALALAAITQGGRIDAALDLSEGDARLLGWRLASLPALGSGAQP